MEEVFEEEEDAAADGATEAVEAGVEVAAAEVAAAEVEGGSESDEDEEELPEEARPLAMTAGMEKRHCFLEVLS